MQLEMECLIDFIECLEEQQTVVHTCVTVVFQEIAGMFQSVGMCEQAVEAYIKVCYAVFEKITLRH